MSHVYQVLLALLYPHRYVAIFGQEMLAVFAQVAAEQRKRGRAAYLLFVIREIAGLARSAPLQWKTAIFDPREFAVNQSLPEEVQECQARLNTANGEMLRAIATGDFATARRLSESDYSQRDKLQTLRKKYGLAE